MSKLIFDVPCKCGKIHKSASCECISGKGALDKIADCVKKFGAKKAFVFGDVNTYPLAGDRICEMLSDCEIASSVYMFPQKHTEPDEWAVGALIMNFDYECDVVVSIGSGVMNDLGKVLSKAVSRPYIIVATAPSMDGYASATSSMSRGGVKVSLNTLCPDVIIGDTDILKTAPVHMIKSGLGDMIAKYTAICEWRISALITDEYYCEAVAGFVRESLKKCIDNVGGVLVKDEKCIEAVFDGLIGTGVAMQYAGCSQPASGGEHYMSHIWDMRGSEFETPVELHGIQCAVGSFYSSKIYDILKDYVPNMQKALEYVGEFDFDKWSVRLREFVGKGADTMISLEKKEQKYDKFKHRERIKRIVENWNKIINIIKEEVPSCDELSKILERMDAPKTLEDMKMDASILAMTIKTSKDIRDKYVLPKLLWDLGILDEIAEKVAEDNEYSN